MGGAAEIHQNPHDARRRLSKINNDRQVGRGRSSTSAAVQNLNASRNQDSLMAACAAFDNEFRFIQGIPEGEIIRDHEIDLVLFFLNFRNIYNNFCDLEKKGLLSGESFTFITRTADRVTPIIKENAEYILFSSGKKRNVIDADCSNFRDYVYTPAIKIIRGLMGIPIDGFLLVKSAKSDPDLKSLASGMAARPRTLTTDAMDSLTRSQRKRKASPFSHLCGEFTREFEYLRRLQGSIMDNEAEFSLFYYRFRVIFNSIIDMYKDKSLAQSVRNTIRELCQGMTRCILKNVTLLLFAQTELERRSMQAPCDVFLTYVYDPINRLMQHLVERTDFRGFQFDPIFAKDDPRVQALINPAGGVARAALEMTPGSMTPGDIFDLRGWLRSIRDEHYEPGFFERYSDNFMRSGFDTKQAIVTMERADFLGLEITNEDHQNVLWAAIQRLAGVDDDDELEIVEETDGGRTAGEGTPGGGIPIGDAFDLRGWLVSIIVKGYEPGFFECYYDNFHYVGFDTKVALATLERDDFGVRLEIANKAHQDVLWRAIEELLNPAIEPAPAVEPPVEILDDDNEDLYEEGAEEILESTTTTGVGTPGESRFLREFLSELGADFEPYYKNFSNAGFDSKETFKTLYREDLLTDLEITDPNHREVLWEAILRLR